MNSLEEIKEKIKVIAIFINENRKKLEPRKIEEYFYYIHEFNNMLKEELKKEMIILEDKYIKKIESFIFGIKTFLRSRRQIYWERDKIDIDLKFL